MTMLPDFSDAARARLKALGVIDAQVEKLRFACVMIRLRISRPAPRNEVAELLGDVAKLSEKLLRKLAAIELQATPAYLLAHLLIEQGYWPARPHDSGASSSESVFPRLAAVRDAAREGKKSLPRVASRYRSADPHPIRAISDALKRGWSSQHGSAGFRVTSERGGEVRTYRADHQSKPFPTTLKASAADGSPFRAIVGICYEAVGGNPDPLAAIKAYLKSERQLRESALAALDAGIKSARTMQRKNRTSTKS